MSTIISFLKKYHYIVTEIFVLFIVSLTPLFWFIPDHMVIGYDSGYPIDFLSYFNQRIYTWLGSHVFGLDTTLWLGQISLFALLAYVYKLGVSMYDVQKITFIFWFFAMSVSMYALVLYLFNHPKYRFIRLCSVIFYVINLFLFSFWIQGEQTTFSAWTLLPLAILLCIRFFENRASIFITAIIANLVFLFFNAGGLLGLPLLGAVIVGCLAVNVFYFILALKKHNGKVLLVRTISLILVSTIIFSFVNAYWLLPFLSQFSQHYANEVTIAGGIQSAIFWTKYISQYTSFSNLIRLQGDLSWYNRSDFYSNFYLNNPALIIISFILPILSFSAYWLVKSRQEKKIILLFLCIALFGLFFSSGTHTPFGFVYVFLMEKLPGFAAFRSAYYKFVPLIYVSFSILFGTSVYYLISRIQTRIARVSIGFMVIIILISYHFPFFDKANFTFEKPFSTMHKIPDYVIDFGKFKREETDYYRTLVLPPLNGYPVTILSWNYWGPSLFEGLSDKPFVQNLSGSFSQQESLLVNSLYQSIRENNFDQFFKFAAALDIHAIMLTRDVAVSFQQFPVENPDKYQKLLEDSKLFYTLWENGPWIVYAWERKPTSAKIFTSNQISLYDNYFSSNSQSVIMGPTPFVFSEQVPEIMSEIPIISLIHYFTCISCIKSDGNYNSDIKLPYSRVNPSSLLYPLKSYIEEKRNKDLFSDKPTDTHLGLSLKRLAEIRALVTEIDQKKQPDSNELKVWEKIANDFYSYWVKLHESIPEYQKEGNYLSLFKTYRYAEFERNELLDIYSKLSQDNLLNIRTIVENSFWETDAIISSLKDVFGIGKKFSFYINTKDSVYTDVRNTPKYRNGDALSYYIVDEIKNTILNEATNSTSLVRTTATPLTTIRYPDDLYDLELSKRTVIKPDKTYNCLSSEIKNYVWNNKYIVSADYPKADDDRRIFITFQKYNSPEVKNRNNNNFKPDQDIIISHNAGKFFKSINGNNNDIGLEISFCSDTKNPELVYSNIQAYEYKPPTLFSVEQKSNNLTVPAVTFTRIDPTEYRVSIQNAETSFILGFLERFSPQWEASFMDSNLPVNQEKYHFIINGFANGWKIERKGSYSIRIKFQSQQNFQNGVVISVASIAVLFGSCCYILGKRLWK